MFRRKKYAPVQISTEKYPPCSKCGEPFYYIHPRYVTRFINIDHSLWDTLHCLNCGNSVWVGESYELVERDGKKGLDCF